jgi:hypothetical protein
MAFLDYRFAPPFVTFAVYLDSISAFVVTLSVESPLAIATLKDIYGMHAK